MGKVVLLGHGEGKRTAYFLKAAKELQIEAEFYNIHNVDKMLLSGKTIKIDPYVYGSSEIGEMNLHVFKYLQNIMELSIVPDVHFLNTPEAIAALLSKKNCKKVLMDNNIRTTDILDYNIRSYDELLNRMVERKVYNVFIKPEYGSGAAGVAAYRYNKKYGKNVIYTSIDYNNGKLVNTKRIFRYEDKLIIKDMLNKILSEDALVERWEPKAGYLDFTYDIRVVVQFGRVDFMVGRLSRSPITNLHLNNNAIDIVRLGLTKDTICQIEEICIKAVSLFEGLNVAGVDVLLTKGDLSPMIIEMNAQGDLIYQDIYNKNVIYTNQVLEMWQE